METTYKEYYFAGLMMAFIACVGCPFSLINLIPIAISYQLIQKASQHQIPKTLLKRLLMIFQIALALTFMTTILYLSFQW
ncbi:hypothetical protein NMU03_15810 [Allocoprobacillus halotolerans]|uniref:MerT mercuric transport protein n=1 Tax=Allocoprobacillus halotolerans TaxID=2944914 RepID=A0ABY5I138_9FIRM|nr:hypothetical protein [Allocoprobacillus halotolerans]UTY39024.1 hypothetical protein NMU03_15810 [Allocoprobacillus halotolerans]